MGWLLLACMQNIDMNRNNSYRDISQPIPSFKISLRDLRWLKKIKSLLSISEISDSKTRNYFGILIKGVCINVGSKYVLSLWK